ncbi:MAG: protein translocase subunit SecD [bacterium]
MKYRVLKQRLLAVVVVIVAVLCALLLVGQKPFSNNFFTNKHPFRLGLDLSGGTHLLYKADTSSLGGSDPAQAMEVLRNLIEKRVNPTGSREMVVETNTSIVSGNLKEYRLSVDLPGVTDVTEAINIIGKTPFLEFKVQSDAPQKVTVGKDGTVNLNQDDNFVSTGLTGKYLTSANLEFNQNTGAPYISLTFDDQGAKLFENITKNNIGKVVAIYLDGKVIQAPVVRDVISSGKAEITGSYTPKEAKDVADELKFGALPVPISLISTETVGATLGGKAVSAGAYAALIGFILISLFLIVWYRIPGIIATISLGMYVVITLLLYRLIPVTLTAAGIAGFIISIGMAVDATILIFERAREERKRGSGVREALESGFGRAWTSIRDANISSLIIGVILYSVGTSLMKGFAVTFIVGVLISMFTAVTITRLLLRAMPVPKKGKVGKFLFSSGFTK